MKQSYILMAFANEQESGHAYLRGLSKEQRAVRKAMETAELQGLCKPIYLYGATASDIFDAFQNPAYQGQIVGFHYSGHANSVQLLLQSEQGGNAPAYAGGLMAFLAKQQSLRYVFLNACATQAHASHFSGTDIPCIATSQSVNDDVATELSMRFYKGLAAGWDLAKAFEGAIDAVNTYHGTGNVRDLYWEGTPDAEVNGMPWRLLGPAETHDAWQWSLAKQQLANQTEGNAAAKANIRQLIAQSKMDEAFKAMEAVFKGTSFENEVTALQKKQSDLKKKSRMGLLSFSEETQEQAKIAHGALELLGELG